MASAGFGGCAVPSDSAGFYCRRGEGTCSRRRFALQYLRIFQAVIAREPAHHGLALPVVEDAAHVFPGDAGHGGEVALGDLLAHQHAAAATSCPKAWARSSN